MRMRVVAFAMLLATPLMTLAVATPGADLSEFPVELQVALHELHEPKPSKHRRRAAEGGC